MANRMAEAYARSRYPNANKVEGVSCEFSHSGHLYSSVSLCYVVDGKELVTSFQTDNFLEWLGGEILKANYPQHEVVDLRDGEVKISKG